MPGGATVAAADALTERLEDERAPRVRLPPNRDTGVGTKATRAAGAAGAAHRARKKAATGRRDRAAAVDVGVVAEDVVAIEGEDASVTRIILSLSRP